jgi:transposase InsO family protein
VVGSIGNPYVVRRWSTQLVSPKIARRPRLPTRAPESRGRDCIAQAWTYGARHILKRPGRSIQNGFIQCFNGRFKDE